MKEVQTGDCKQIQNHTSHACAHAHTTAIFVFYPSQPSQKSLEHDEKQGVTREFRTYFNTLTKEQKNRRARGLGKTDL